MRGARPRNRVKKGPPRVGEGLRVVGSGDGYSIQRVSQSMTSSCHWMELLGFSTQWFSSG